MNFITRHLTFPELQMLKEGKQMSIGCRIHLLFCRQCRNELAMADWKLCDEMRKNYIQNEQQVKDGFDKNEQ